MIVLATGSSKWTDRNVIYETLDETYEEAIARQAKMTPHQKEMFPFETGIHVLYGACPTGADFFVEEWILLKEGEGWIVGHEDFPADWTSHSSICPPPADPSGVDKHNRWKNGKPYCPSAGIRRNLDMVQHGEAYRDRYLFQSICLAWCLNDSTGTIQCGNDARRKGYDLRPFRQGTTKKRL